MVVEVMKPEKACDHSRQWNYRNSEAWRIFLILWVLMGGIFLFGGCATSSVDPGYEALLDSEAEFPPSGELGIGDIFTIDVFGEKTLSGTFTVGPDGAITYPFLGRISIVGKTCTDVEIQLIKGLVGRYLRSPSVRCTINEYVSKRVYLFGEFKKPGSIAYRSQMSIVEAVAEAGGFSENARLNQLKLSRKVNGTEIQVTVPIQEIIEGRRSNLRLLPGDILFMPTRLY